MRVLLAIMPVSLLAYSLTVMLEVKCPSETVVNFQWAACYYILEGRTVEVFLIYFFFSHEILLHIRLCWVIR
jgi:hypothetical protein